MNYLFLLSVIFKGAGAILEILLQILVTRNLGVAGYGTYSGWINAADLVFWVLFSGLVKCNTFYLSGKTVSIGKFKRRYYLWYALPVLAVVALVCSALSGVAYGVFILVITGLELVALDQSSTLIAVGQGVTSLIGEYIFGRLILLGGVVGLSLAGRFSLNALLVLYGIQYIGIVVFYIIGRKKHDLKATDISDTVSLKKWGMYQRADIMQALISQMPVVIQYFFSGAFEAGVVSIVLLVKKLINFISGPAAKIFLPEFSRLYREGNKDGIRDSFASVMRLQMLFIGPMAVALIGFPEIILRILADDLLAYKHLFVACSAVFLTAATLGPCGGVMQMTGNEKRDNQFREAALLAMAVVMILFSGDSMFVLYGLCTQTTIEALGKYIFVCRWMEHSPVGIGRYLGWWLVPAGAILLVWAVGLQDSVPAMILTAGAVFASGIFREIFSDTGLLRKWRKVE